MNGDSTCTNGHKRLQEELLKYLSWGPVTEWHSSMFTELSEKIFDKCQIMLSPATLKRFFGVVNHDGLPSITTLEALAQYIGYKNYRTFKLSIPGRRSYGTSLPKKSLYVSAGFLIALVIIVVIGTKLPEDPKLLETINFSSRPVTNTYPNSVVFDFDLKNISSDSIHIQQYWDVTKTVILNREQKQATGIYYFPGYFRAKLMVDGKAVKEHDLFLRSNGWLGTIEYEPVPKYFMPLSIERAILTYPKELAREIKNSSEPLISVYNYIDDLGNISGDNFTLKASIRTTFNEIWAVCQASRIYIIGTTGAMIIPFSKIGCSSDNNLMLNDVYLSGKEHDLSAFATELNKFTDVEISVNEKVFILSINDSEVYRKEYRQSMGMVVGLRFKFLGLGEVKSFTLLDQNCNEVALR